MKWVSPEKLGSEAAGALVREPSAGEIAEMKRLKENGWSFTRPPPLH